MSTKAKVRLRRVVSIVTALTTIMWLSGIALMPLAAKAVTLNEGDLIRGPDGIKVYIINANGYKRHIFNPAVFNMYGHLKWSGIKSVDQATLDSYKVSDLYRSAGEHQVYQTAADGIKRWLDMTWDQFIASGYKSEQVFTVNMTEKNYYSTGSALTYTGSQVPAETATGATLTVALASDTPASALVVKSAARAPFLKVNLTAGSADVNVTKWVIERQGVAQDSNFTDLVLLDAADMTQIGLAQSLNSVHQATFTETVAIAKGTTKSIIIAGNMASTLQAGETPKIALKEITTSATVSGSFPMVGNSMTANNTLAIGSATAALGSLDPGADATKNIGTAAYTFAGIKLTAGSTEDITVEQFRFNQSGSAASSDLTNVKVKVGSSVYDTKVSSDGKYYTAIFGSGIVIAKGDNREFSIYGDIVGGSNRTVAMDVYKKTDLVIKGNTYGYSITVGGGSAGAAADGNFSSDSYPFYNSYDVTISKGTLRVDKSNSVIAGNIAEGSTQTLGSLDFVVQGESVRISDLYLDMDIEVSDTTNTTGADITLVTVYDKDGNAILGPVDATVDTDFGDGDDGDAYVRYTSTLVTPAGTNVYTVKAKLSSDFTNNDTIRIGMGSRATQLSAGPAGRVVSATGQTTGESITATPTTATWANTQTIKTGSLAVSVSTQPVAQSVVKGINGFTFAKILFDASASGEDVKVTSFRAQHIVSAAAEGNKVASLRLYDGNTAITSGSNVVNPSDVTNTTQEDTYTFDTPLNVPKQAIKTIEVRGNISASATGDTTHRFGLDSTPAVNATGASTGTTITAAISTSNGQIMTVVSNGAFSVALDAGTHTGKLAYAGATGVEMSRLRFTGTSEAVSLTDFVLKFGSASTSQNDLVKIYLYDTAGNKLSEQIATTTAQIPFVISSGSFIIPKDGEKVMVVKADISAIGTSQPGTAGHIIALDYNGSQYYAVKGSGQDSGATITSDTRFNTAQSSVYIFKGIPKVEKVALTSNTLDNGTKAAYKFKVSAQGNDIDLYKFTFKVSTTTMEIEDFTLVDVSSSAEQTLYASSTNTGAIQGVYSSGVFADIILLASPGSMTSIPGDSSAITPVTVSTATSKTFEVRLTASGVATGDSLSIQLEGDDSTGLNGSMNTVASVDAWTADDFIWSDRSGSTTHGTSIAEWTNGYLIDGLPSSNLAAETLSK